MLLRDVQAARADRERSKNKQKLIQTMLYQEHVEKQKKFYSKLKPIRSKSCGCQAEGEASRFLAIYNEYAKAKRVTQERMYLETMEKF